MKEDNILFKNEEVTYKSSYFVEYEEISRITNEDRPILCKNPISLCNNRTFSEISPKSMHYLRTNKLRINDYYTRSSSYIKKSKYKNLLGKYRGDKITMYDYKDDYLFFKNLNLAFDSIKYIDNNKPSSSAVLELTINEDFPREEGDHGHLMIDGKFLFYKFNNLQWVVNSVCLQSPEFSTLTSAISDKLLNRIPSGFKDRTKFPFDWIRIPITHKIINTVILSNSYVGSVFKNNSISLSKKLGIYRLNDIKTTDGLYTLCGELCGIEIIPFSQVFLLTKI